jgi:outer membrane protein OmpA-like peptidoglycan-associated protein
MAIKKRLLATAAIPFLAIAGAGLSASAAVVRPVATIEARSSIITVQSEEELQPKKHRKRDSQQQSAEPATDAGNDAAVEEPVRKNRKKQQQAEEQQMEQVQPSDNAEAVEEPVRKNRKKQQQQAEEQQQVDEAQPSDNAEAVEEPVRKNRKKQQQQAEEQQQLDETKSSDNAQAVDEPAPKKRKKNQQAQDAEQGNDAVSDEDIVNQGKKRKKQQQAEEQQQTDEAQPADNAEATEEPVRKKNQQQADDQQQADPAQVSDDDIVNQGKKRKNRNKAEAETPAVIEKREEIAKDPSKTTDTVVLPVENGAAVLDSDKDADNSGANREKRKRQRENVEEVRVPESDKDSQKTDVNIVIKPVIELKGERVDDFQGYRRPEGRNVGKGDDVRIVFDLDGKIVIRSNDGDRIGRNEQTRYERLNEGRIKEVVIRPNGDRVVTIRNRWGEIIRRSRIDNRDVEIVIFYSPDLERGRDQLFLRDPGDDLPPMRLRVPIDDYIIDVSSNRDRDYDYEEFLAKPPVEQVERVYSIDEVKNSARIRDKVRRIDLDTITFDTGSAEITKDQASTLREVAKAIGDILERDPGETFLIEGHTDAVGSDESNLVLSDERAESIANVLTDLFDIPAENLTTQGYGERYLKIDTDGDARENRRVTIRRISPLVRPAEVSEN